MGTFGERLSAPARAVMHSDLLEGDPCMVIDDCLQFTLLEGVEVPSAILDDIEATLNAGYDSKLLDRTLSWIAQHRAA